jgi:hypothetical protein
VRNLRGQAPGDWPNNFRTSRLIPAVEYIRAQRARTLLIEKFEKFMADWDVLVIPPNSLLTTTNLTGNPQVVMKCGFVNNLPRSIGFLGRIYDEGAPWRGPQPEQATGGTGKTLSGHNRINAEPSRYRTRSPGYRRP